MEYLDFELPIKEINEQLSKCRVIGDENEIDVTDTCDQLEEKLKVAKEEIYGNLSPWQRSLSRHPSRPYTLDYIRALCGDTFLELHGDRNVRDDKAMIGGLGKINDQSFMFIGTQKGYNTATRKYRNFGMANPEGYRKALRLMQSAEKFGLPIISFVDTPGAYPGLEAEERGQEKLLLEIFMKCYPLKYPLSLLLLVKVLLEVLWESALAIVYLCSKTHGIQSFHQNHVPLFCGAVGNTKNRLLKL